MFPWKIYLRSGDGANDLNKMNINLPFQTSIASFLSLYYWILYSPLTAPQEGLPVVVQLRPMMCAFSCLQGDLILFNQSNFSGYLAGFFEMAPQWLHIGCVCVCVCMCVCVCVCVCVWVWVSEWVRAHICAYVSLYCVWISVLINAFLCHWLVCEYLPVTCFPSVKL